MPPWVSCENGEAETGGEAIWEEGLMAVPVFLVKADALGFHAEKDRVRWGLTDSADVSL